MQVKQFLIDKEQVKIVMKLKGRQNANPVLAVNALNAIATNFPKNKINAPKQAGRTTTMIIFP